LKTTHPVRAIVILVTSVALALGFSGCGHKAASADAEEGNKGDSSPTADVTLTQVVRADISQVLDLTGTAAAPPNRDVRVSSLVPGRLASLKVAEGDRVHAGQLLAKLDDRPYRDQLQQASAGEAQAKASLENTKLSLARNQDLFQRGIAARKDLEDARTQTSVAEAALRQAEATLEIARLQVARTEILSPLDGQVVKRFVSDGEQVDGTAAQPIVEVANLNDLEFLASAPGRYLAKLRSGEQVQVTTEAVPGKTFSGRVIASAPAVDPATGVGVVRIRVPNPGGLLKIGFFMSAQVAVEHHAQALTVPPEAIYRNEANEPRVFLVNGDTATAAAVTPGIETKDRVELLASENDAVKAGDTVILAGGYGLGEKARIRSKPEQSSSRPSQ
jgi:RND family efflux transporter MFP subunit